MPRITCQTPASGKPVTIAAAGISASWTTVAEAPDFSLPDPSNVYPDRDPGDAARAIRPGEVMFLTPLWARNNHSATLWVEVRLVEEDGTTVVGPRTQVPAGATAPIPLQLRSLVKRNPSGPDGDRVQIRAETAGHVDIWGQADERTSAEHIGVKP